MAVQAHFPPNIFSADFLDRMVASSVVADDVQMFQEHNRNLLCPNVFGFAKDCRNGGTAFSNDPQKSELACNASASRKRARDDRNDRLNVVSDELISFAGLQMMQSAHSTSATGRSTVAVTSAPSMLAQDRLLSNLYQQNLEIDAFVRLQNERLRLRLEEARKRHCQALLASMEQDMAARLREKDTELDNARWRNAELQEKLRQMTAENQIWFTVAKNNEAIISGLKASLEQVLLQNAAVDEAGDGSPAGCVVDTREGYGDSDVDASMPVEDTRSCCLEDEASAGNSTEGRRGKTCKLCGEAEVCVLLLPCRDLCLCKSCESNQDKCPVCGSTRKASLDIFIS